VGQLVRNRAGRIEFVFDRALVEALELGLGPVSTALPMTAEIAGGRVQGQQQATQQQLHARHACRHGCQALAGLLYKASSGCCSAAPQCCRP
jgi:hypothetical protein